MFIHHTPEKRYRELCETHGQAALRLHRDDACGFFYVTLDDGRLLRNVVEIVIRDAVDGPQRITLTFLGSDDLYDDQSAHA